MLPVFRLFLALLFGVAAARRDRARRRPRRRQRRGASPRSPRAQRRLEQGLCPGRPEQGSAGAENRSLARLFRAARPTIRFAEIAGFIDQNPDWPSQKKTAAPRRDGDRRRRATTPRPTWLKRHPPISGFGKVRAAEIVINRGKTEAGTAALRTAWIEGDFGPFDERGLLARHGVTAAPGRPPGPARPADLGRPGRCGPPHAAAGLGRLPGACRSASGPRRRCRQRRPQLVAKVPEALRADPGLAFEEARWRRKKDKIRRRRRTAARRISAQPGPAGVWWSERLVCRPPVAGRRQCRDRVSARRTRICPVDDDEYSEAEFLSVISRCASARSRGPRSTISPISSPVRPAPTPRRGPHTGAGAPPRRPGKADLATKWYAAGAEHSATFYGQLAAHQLGKDAPPQPVPEPRPTDAEQARFDAQELVRAARLFLAAGDRARAMNFLMQMAESGKDSRSISRCWPRLPKRMAGSIWRSRWRGARSTPACR